MRSEEVKYVGNSDSAEITSYSFRDDKPFKILFVGRLTYQKNIKLLLKAIENTEYELDIVGGLINTISYGEIGEAIAKAQSSWFGVGGGKYRIIKSNNFRSFWN